MRGVRRLTRGKKWDLVFATSSRLMTAALGSHIAPRMKVPLYLDIRDLFVDNMDELLAGSPLKLLLPVFRQIERYAFRSAARLNVVSAGFLPHVSALAPHLEPRVFTNGIDDLFLTEEFVNSTPASELPLIVYAGNMGEGQGLHHIVPRVAQLLTGKARLRLIGDGGRRTALESALVEAKVDNVELLSPVPRSTLIEHYRDADILFLHLNDLKAFRKVLPSKIFEYAATGKPVLAGVAGYAAEFIKADISASEVFFPCDSEEMVASFNRLLQQPRSSSRKSFCEKYYSNHAPQVENHFAKNILEK